MSISPSLLQHSNLHLRDSTTISIIMVEDNKKKRKHTTFNDDSDGDNEHSEVVKAGEDPNNDKGNDDKKDPKEEGNEEGEEAEEKSKRKRKRKRKKKSTDNDDNDESNNKNLNGGKNHEEKVNSLEYTVYVEGIPFDCTEEDVKGFFVEHGCEDVIQMRLPRYVLKIPSIEAIGFTIVCIHSVDFLKSSFLFNEN